MKYLKSYKLFEEFNTDLDLSNYESAKKWLIINGGDDILNDDCNDLDYEYRDSYTYKDIEEIIYDYINFYKKYKDEEYIEIYRLIKLNTLKDLELDDIGKWWSFEENGIGAYSSGRREFKGNKFFVLTGIIKPEDIDWKYGFNSYTYYPHESECALNKGVKVLITEINGEKINKKLIGIVK